MYLQPNIDASQFVHRPLFDLIFHSLYINGKRTGSVTGMNRSRSSIPKFCKRCFSDYWSGTTREGTSFRVGVLKAPSHMGAVTSRGSRPSNEDRFRVGVLDNVALKKADTGPLAFYFAVMDGHGGSGCSQFLEEQLHVVLEGAEAKEAQNVVNNWRTVGGYFKRFHPQVLDDIEAESLMSIPQRLTLAFLQTDWDWRRKSQIVEQSRLDGPNIEQKRLKTSGKILSPAVRTVSNKVQQSSTEFKSDGFNNKKSGNLSKKQDIQRLDTAEYHNAAKDGQAKDDECRLEADNSGSCASVVLAISLDAHLPFWDTPNCELHVAHVGDTRVLACRTKAGLAMPLTRDHHPSSTTESARLRRFAHGFGIDSFGEERFGFLANTRAFGDMPMKKLGVSAEPEITTIVSGQGDHELAFVVLVTDGVTNVLSDQEIVDIVKGSPDPKKAAVKIVDLAESLGTQDNSTCIVVRLSGWGTPMPDFTKDMRAYRLQEASEKGARRT